MNYFTNLHLLADSLSASLTLKSYVVPTIRSLSALALLVCTLVIIHAGYLYMTSSGRPEALDRAKNIFKKALIGLVIVFSAGAIVGILSSAYGQPASGQNAVLPNLQAITPQAADNGLIEVLIKAVSGFLLNIIETVAQPFLGALDYFTKETPLMADNKSVFNLWLAIVGLSNILLILVLVLVGLQLMSAASLGFDELDFKHLLPQVILVFIGINSSIFIIDAVIELSNTLIRAVGQISGASAPWDTLKTVVESAGSQGLAALLLMLVFVVFSVVLLIYYLTRLVALFIGAVLSPLIFLLWLVPGFRDFALSAMKTYIATIFVLFVHVVILLLAASLFSGLVSSSTPDAIMALVLGIATILALLKTQGLLMQFSLFSGGARSIRKLGSQLTSNVSYLSRQTKVSTLGAGQKLSSRLAKAGPSYSYQPSAISYKSSFVRSNPASSRSITQDYSQPTKVADNLNSSKPSKLKDQLKDKK